jgi:6-phosphogluconolactonase
MYRALAKQDVPWPKLQIVQVDERVAPTGDPDRNLTHLRESLAAAPLRPERVHTMDVEAADLQAAAKQYAATLREIAGNPPLIDLVHLGLGPDGHTASLLPGDNVLDVIDSDVAMTGGAYQGRTRMTLTYPAINRARRILWVVTGKEKAAALARMRDGDPSIPAGRINHEHAIVFSDRAAASKLEEH